VCVFRSLIGSALTAVLLAGAAVSAQDTFLTVGPHGGGTQDPHAAWVLASRRAVARHDVAALRALLQQEQAEPVSTGFTLVMIATYAPQGDVVRTVVGLGADVNRRGFNGMSALMLAATTRNEAMVRLLLELGADPHATNQQGETAYDLARRANRFYFFALPLLPAYSVSFTWPFRDAVQVRMMGMLRR
jgi:ankyrin repeat protein